MDHKYISMFILLALLAACLPAQTISPEMGKLRTLTVMTHDSFAVSEEVIRAFETETVKVKFLKAGDTGTALNKAILSKDNPLADVFYGVDNTYLSRALSEEIFESYTSPMVETIPMEFKLDEQLRAIPVDFGDVCINYDVGYFETNNLPVPRNLDDLANPEILPANLLVVQNPATSSPGLAFMLTTIGVYGEQGYLDYWQRLVAQGVLVVNDWETAYYTEFSVHGGTRPVVVSYASSPPAEVIFAEAPIEQPPTAVMTGGRSCFRQIEFVGILKGTANRDLAEKWIDFMLSTTFQQDMPMQMFVFPVNPAAQLPELFAKHTIIPEVTAQVSPQQISAHREQWIKDWTETVLR